MTASSAQNSIMATQVREHGEILARLVYIVEEDHKDLDELKKAVEIIAKSVARQEEKDVRRARMIDTAKILAAALISGVAGHFIH